jgi:hypothetical protein
MCWTWSQHSQVCVCGEVSHRSDRIHKGNALERVRGGGRDIHVEGV